MDKLAEKIVIGIPTTGGCKNATEIWMLVQAQRGFRFIYGVGPLSVEDSRTQIVSKFLGTQKDITHLLFLDYDVVPPMNAIEEMYKMDKDMVAANYPIYMDTQIHSASFKLVPEKDRYTPFSYVDTGIHEVDAVGLGCTLIKREVLEKAVQHRCFEMTYGWDKGVFKMKCTEDIIFSKVVKYEKFQIFVNLDLRCDHYKTVSLAGVVEDHQKGCLLYAKPKE